MTSTVNLSHNELWSLLTRVFEALYGHDRDYYDMARTVLRMECYGFDGVEQLIAALPNLEQVDLPASKYTQISKGHYQLDGGGRSLFCLGRTAMDLVLADSVNHKLARLDLVNVSDPDALLGLLYSAPLQNMAAAALCADRLAVIGRKDDCPDVYEGGPSDFIGLACAHKEADLWRYLTGDFQSVIGPKAQQSIFDLGLQNGLTISKIHYAALNKVADRVLVEATEASRRGAGE